MVLLVLPRSRHESAFALSVSLSLFLAQKNTGVPTVRNKACVCLRFQPPVPPPPRFRLIVIFSGKPPT